MKLNPWRHLVLASDHKHTSIIAYTFLTNDVLVCVAHLFGDAENIITIQRNCGEFLFLCPRLCQPGSMLCHALGVNVGSFCLLAPAVLLPFFRALYTLNHACLSCTALSTCSFHHMVSSLHWWVLARSQTSLAASTRGPFNFDEADSISSGTSSSGSCSGNSNLFYLEGGLDLVSCRWCSELLGADAKWKPAFRQRAVWAQTGTTGYGEF